MQAFGEGFEDNIDKIDRAAKDFEEELYSFADKNKISLKPICEYSDDDDNNDFNEIFNM